MNIQFATAKASSVADKWRKQYQMDDGKWRGIASGSSETTYNKLLQAPDDVEFLAKIIGNKGWTHVSCESCGSDELVVVVFERYEERYAVCRSCVKAAYAALEAVKDIRL